jgi:dipeptidyl aminopeptidase/acylaminoacyl peptidase
MDRGAPPIDRSVRLRTAPLFLALLPTLSASPSPAAAPLDAYGRLPSIEQAALSPDGSTIAFVETTQDWRALAIVDVNNPKLIGGVRLGDTKLRSVEWADDEHLLLTTASNSMPFGLVGERTEWHLLSVYNVRTKKLSSLLNHVNGDLKTMNTVYGTPVVQRKGNDTLLFIHGVYVSEQTESALFRINLTTSAEDLVRQGNDKTNAWLVDDTGEIVAEQDYTEREHRWEIRLFRGGHPRQSVSGVAPIDAPEILGLSAAGDAIVVALTEADRVTWRPLSIKDGVWGAEIAADETLTGVVLKNGSRRMIGTAFIGDKTRYHFADRSLQEGWDWIERAFGYQRVEFVSASADYAKILVEVMGPKSGYAYYLADVKEHVTSPVGKIYAGVAQIAEVRPVKYTAADGLEIPAYLTLPPDRPAQNLPIVIFPHGGPQARDSLEFDWWAQALAAQGYAVLQPNYRGSDLGQKWVESGYGEWGRKMQTDLSDGLRFLAAQGIVDPQRACIVGASYGGYAALAGVAIQSGIYRCAVAVAGISDPGNFMRWVKRAEAYGNQVGLRYWERFLGVTDPGDKRLDAISPLRHADQISVPLMLIHGRDDTTVPFDQTADLAKVLKRAGKPAVVVTLDKEDHYLSRSATRLQMLQASIDFLRKYNPPD